MHRRSYGVHFFYIGENAVLVELMREPTPTASNVSWPNGLRVPTVRAMLHSPPDIPLAPLPPHIMRHTMTQTTTIHPLPIESFIHAWLRQTTGPTYARSASLVRCCWAMVHVLGWTHDRVFFAIQLAEANRTITNQEGDAMVTACDALAINSRPPSALEYAGMEQTLRTMGAL